VPPREVAEPYALHHSGNVEPFGVNLRWHGWRGTDSRKRAIVSDRGRPAIGNAHPPGVKMAHRAAQRPSFGES
jgi:hypothetical protein